MTTAWQFLAVRGATQSGFTWHWRRTGTRVPVTSAPFDFYFDCVSDARANGYAGPMPAGPKVPLDRLATAPVTADRASKAMPVQLRLNTGSLIVTPVSAVEVRKRRAMTEADGT